MEALADAGGWCWFHAPRAVSVGGRTVAGTVRPDGAGRAVVALMVLDHRSGASSEVVLDSDAVLDDHNAPAVAHLGGTRFGVAWTGHYATPLVRLQVVDLADPQAPVTVADTGFDAGAPATYCALAQQPDGTVLVLTRSLANNPTYALWDPGTGAITAPRRWLAWEVPRGAAHYSGRDGGRPYVVYQPAPDGTVHFAVSHDHPRAYRNGVLAGRIAAGLVQDAHGRPLAALGERAVPLEELTEVVPAGGDPAWVHDVAVVEGVLAIAYQRAAYAAGAFGRPDAERGPCTLTYHVAELVDRAWEHATVAHAGSALYADEADYTGGMSLSRTMRGTCAVSSSVDPVTGAPAADGLAHVFALTRVDSGRWAASRISGPPDGLAHLRPVYSEPLDEGPHALLWLTGEYRRFTDYRLGIAGEVYLPGSTCLRDADMHLDTSFPLLAQAMPEEERAELDRALRASERYLEFGAGGSTAHAIEVGVPDVVTVETDARTASQVRRLLGTRLAPGQRLEVLTPVDGTAVEWGHPLMPTSGEDYVGAPAAQRPGWAPDLVLIDGRFRVASFLAALAIVSPGATILVDDFVGRDAYTALTAALAPTRIVGRMAVFENVQPQTADPGLLAEALGVPW